MNGSDETGSPPQPRVTTERRPWSAPLIIDSAYVSRAQASTPHPFPEGPPTSSGHS